MPGYAGAGPLAKIYSGANPLARIYKGADMLWKGGPSNFNEAVLATTPYCFFRVQRPEGETGINTIGSFPDLTGNVTATEVGGGSADYATAGFSGVSRVLVPSEPNGHYVRFSGGRYMTIPFTGFTSITTLLLVSENLDGDDPYSRDQTTTGGWITRLTGSNRIGGTDRTLSAYAGAGLMIVQRDDGGIGRYFRNGVEVPTSGAAAATAPVSPFNLSKNGNNSGTSNGRYAAFALWNRALTADEIASISTLYLGS